MELQYFNPLKVGAYKIKDNENLVASVVFQSPKSRGI